MKQLCSLRYQSGFYDHKHPPEKSISQFYPGYLPDTNSSDSGNKETVSKSRKFRHHDQVNFPDSVTKVPITEFAASVLKFRPD